jgi:phosphatidylserine/phosphatidylglycerophosphate/cardiolipin synthase-like enzyme
VSIRGVLDRVQGAAKWAPTQQLKDAGVELHANRPGTGVRKVHHKLMVIDEQLVIAGSFNFTGPAGTINDENIVVLGDLEETSPVARAAQGQLAGYALAEIDRIIADLADPV